MARRRFLSAGVCLFQFLSGAEVGSECPLCQQDRGWTGVSAAQDWTSGRGCSGHALLVRMGHTKPVRHCKQPASLPHPCPHSISTRGPSHIVHHRRWSLCDAGLRSCPHPPVGRWPAQGTGHGESPLTKCCSAHTKEETFCPLFWRKWLA